MDKKLKNIKAVFGKLKGTEEKVTKLSFTKDGITRSIKVREVENGFITEINEVGEDEKGTWHWATQTWISFNNPLNVDNDGDIDLSKNIQATIQAAFDNLKLQ